MISYKPFWRTLEKRNLNQYVLCEQYEISRSLLDKLRHDKDVRLSTIDRLCEILDCSIEDIVEIVREDIK